MLAVNSTPGMMIDDTFYPEAFIGFRLLIGNGLQSRSLPSTIDLSRFYYNEGSVMLDGNGTMLVEFTVDSIVDLPPTVFEEERKAGQTLQAQRSLVRAMSELSHGQGTPARSGRSSARLNPEVIPSDAPMMVSPSERGNTCTEAFTT